MSQHNTAPQPERSRKELISSIWGEVLATDQVMGTFPGFGEVGVDGWQYANPKEAALEAGFRRGRRIMQAISYGNKYWEVEFGMGVTLDKESFDKQHDVVKLGARRLFQLVVLSRVNVPDFSGNEQWAIPTFQDIQRTKHDVREELGVAEAYLSSVRDHESGLSFVDFPGIDDSTLIDAILAGTVTVGNPEQPDAQCWRP